MSQFVNQQLTALKKRNNKGSEQVFDFSTENQVDISRASKWRNPFLVSKGLSIYEVQKLYEANFWINYLQDSLGELLGKKLVTSKGEESYHKDFLLEMLKKYNEEDGFIYDKLEPIEVTLYNLHRRKIFLEPVKSKTGGFNELVFHLFDTGDNLTMEKITEYTAWISEFMAYHAIPYKYSINVYSWSELKCELYKNRFTITQKAIARVKTVPNSIKTELFENFFTGLNFINLDIDRFFPEKGKHYLSRRDNKKLIEGSKHKNDNIRKENSKKKSKSQANNEEPSLYMGEPEEAAKKGQIQKIDDEMIFDLS